MSGFTPAQLHKLNSKLDRARVQTRSVDGRQLDYIEGWFALNEANAIFGFANWDRETVHFERLFERVRGDSTTCAYLARVRIRVRAGDKQILREGTGCGSASARNCAEAHDLAIKGAETDATKRALATFGNRFGLCLYDKERAGVRDKRPPKLQILCPDGQLFADALPPAAFCAALRKIIESTKEKVELTAWRERNAKQIARLREVAPDLKTPSGKQYADILEALFRARQDAAIETSKNVNETIGTNKDDNGLRPIATGFNRGRNKIVAATDTAPRACAIAQPDTTPAEIQGHSALSGETSHQRTEALSQVVHFKRSDEPSNTLSGELPSDGQRAVPIRKSAEVSVAVPNFALTGVRANTEAASSQSNLTVSESAEERSTVVEAAGSPGTPEASAKCQETQQSSALPLAPSRIAFGARIDKAGLAIGTLRRLRDKAHLRHVGTLPCLVCKKVPSHPHHLTFAQSRGLALKVSDEFVVPLCAEHHNDLHRSGTERLWWKRLNIEPLTIARGLWRQRASINSIARSS